MSEFISSVETNKGKKNERVYFLTRDQIYNTPRGKIIGKKYPGEGYIGGHSAIRDYYGIREESGVECEYTDFSTPGNFPAVIVAAIKNGEMRDMGYSLDLLSENALDALDDCPELVPTREAYEQARETNDKAWEAVGQAREAYGQAQETYNKAWEASRQAREAYKQARRETYDKAWGAYKQAREAYKQARREAYDKAWGAYKQAREACEQAWEAVGQAREAYEQARETVGQARVALDKAWGTYNKEWQRIFWDLFAIPENRNPLWR